MSLSQNVEGNESSMITQLTAQTNANSYNSNAAASFGSKVNLNKNKLQGTCREYKHLDDEWKFDVDSLEVIEATPGNVFHEPHPLYMPAQNPPLGKHNYGGMGYASLQPLLLE